MSAVLKRAISRLVCWLDRLVPQTDSVVLRTFPDLVDDGRELVRALQESGVEVVWLVDDPASARSRVEGCRFVGTVSPAGMWAFWRARVVVHTHGVFGAHRCSPAKRFVNIWHGMPVKRLVAASDVGRNQTDVTIATADVHARNLAETWQLSRDQVELTGLPRNDLLVKPLPRDNGWLTHTVSQRPLVVWLPTFRTAAVGDKLSDGLDFGLETQFAGADLATVDQLMGELGALCVIKPHPLAAPPERVERENVTVLGDADLATADLTLYELLAHADVLVTDHSSVWIDFLLTGRPMVFAVSDRSEYEASRGYYFDDLEALLPGPLVEDLDALRGALREVVGTDGDGWVDDRERALKLHHVHADHHSADRVAAVVVRELSRAR